MKKGFLLSLMLFILSSCDISKIKGSIGEFKDSSTERVKAFLVEWPVINRWIKLHPKPERLYREVELGIASLRANGVEKYFPEEYTTLAREWKEAKRAYEDRLYLTAEKKLKVLHQKVKRTKEKLQKNLSEIKNSAHLKLKEREAGLSSQLKALSPEERLKIKAYLFWLKNLIEQGRFDEFERALQMDPLG